MLLPPGAFGSALRGAAYFDGAGVLGPMLVLAAYVAASLLLSLSRQYRLKEEV
jgi:hypothetical protein